MQSNTQLAHEHHHSATRTNQIMWAWWTILNQRGNQQTDHCNHAWVPLLTERIQQSLSCWLQASCWMLYRKLLWLWASGYCNCWRMLVWQHCVLLPMLAPQWQQQQWQWWDNDNDNDDDDDETMTMTTMMRQQWQWWWWDNDDNDNDETTTMTMTRQQQWQQWQWDDNDDDETMTILPTLSPCLASSIQCQNKLTSSSENHCQDGSGFYAGCKWDYCKKHCIPWPAAQP